MDKPRILVVDDEDVICQLLKRTLDRRGFDVETAQDGNAALEKSQRNSFNVIITDLKMPKVSGMEVLKEIKKNNPYIEVIIITGYPTIESAVEAVKIGAIDFLSKPFDLDILVAAIERSFERQKTGLNYFKLSEMMALFEISKSVILNSDFDGFLTKVLNSALEITNSKNGRIFLVDEKTKELILKVERGLNKDIAEEAKFSLEVPLRSFTIDSGNNLLGVLKLADKISCDDFTEREETLISILAGEATVAIENFKLYQELGAKVVSLNQTIEKLNQTQAQLVQFEKLAALGRFASGVAHEVKNPLAIILGGIEFLESKLSQADTETKIAIQKIEESTVRADTIIRNLLEFSRPSELKIEKLGAKNLIEDSLSLMKFRLPLKNIKVETDFPEEGIIIAIDKNQMMQVLFNILVNSVEAMPKGGNIKIRIYKSRIGEFLPEKTTCVIEIIDSGEGIAAEHLPKLFEPFFTTKEGRKGTGLGLSMSKIIVERHDGRLLLDSKRNEGTNVRIILPLEEELKNEKDSSR